MNQNFSIIILLLIASIPAQAADVQDVYTLHLAWKNAFEQADLATVDTIWDHAADATLITVGGVPIKGFEAVRREIQKTFDRVGQSAITVSNLVITVESLAASATSDYLWSPLPDLPLKATELYRKVDGEWKMHAQDGGGKLPPLRPNAEKRIKKQVKLSHAALINGDIEALFGQIADLFTYVAIDGTVHRKFRKAVIRKDLEKIKNLRQKVIYLAGDGATAHYTLSSANANEWEIKLVYNKNFQLKTINFAPKALAVEPDARVKTTWGRLKTERGR